MIHTPSKGTKECQAGGMCRLFEEGSCHVKSKGGGCEWGCTPPLQGKQAAGSPVVVEGVRTHLAQPLEAQRDKQGQEDHLQQLLGPDPARVVQ